ncbi:hypothetical protein OSB04_006745 [Centaurea solstitialis]|uniref:Reverse transcriptase Ty1/copia-type domain-containing protein n=1 Tax=Centaurea solstitialis TaxID=347529 RepID=A0AA38TIH7_9ASTR|nr:hypothetical protein OSB04_006745 [Centaurea solstitialis]
MTSLDYLHLMVPYINHHVRILLNWGEALLTATYLINRIPTAHNSGLSPFEKLYGESPNYSFLRVFGCTCFVLRPHVERNKLSPRSALCVFLWYGIGQKGYRCFDPVSQKLYVSRHVTFLEHIPFFSIPTQSHDVTKSDLRSIDPFDTDTNDTFSDVPAHETSTTSNTHETSRPSDSATPMTAPVPDETMANAMAEELAAVYQTHTWDLVPLPTGKHVIGCRWVFKIKTKFDGSVEWYKARLVAKGYSQQYGMGYDETFAPVAKMTTVRTLIAAASIRQWKICQMDVKNAFLNGEVCQLRKALYGLKQAPHAWFENFSTTKYISDLLERARLSDKKTVDTPLETNVHYTPTNGVPLSYPSLYRTIVGSLVYLTGAVLRILRYLRGTQFQSLLFPSTSSLKLSAYSDASWDSDPSDRKCTTGFCIFLGDSLISWKSKKQDVVSRSSIEVEYHAMEVTTCEIVWLRWLLADMGVDVSQPTPLQCDNKSSM